MCEPTNGGACGCAPTATTKQTKRRTCETAGCPRVSGDARFCRTCRAVAPVRAGAARAQATHDALAVQHDHARGQEVRLRRAKAEIATLTTRLRIAWGVIGLLCVALGVVGVFG